MNASGTLLTYLLAQQESEIVEFRVKADPQSLARTVVAFLNSRGGTIVLGVGESDSWIGIDSPDRVQADLETFFAANIAPEVTLRFERVEEEGRQGLILEVPSGSAKPYVFDGAIYVRRGASSDAAAPGEITRIVEQRSRDEERWERKLALGIEPEQLDKSEVSLAFQHVSQRFDVRVNSHSPTVEKLERLDLLADGWPRNAAVVLFIGEAGRRRYPQLAAHATVLNSVDHRDFVDSKVFEGNAFSLFDQLMKFVGQHGSVRSTIRSGDVVRTDHPTVPPLVLREAILNAIAHREYQEASPIQLRLFSNRLELWNPGSISPELIGQPGVSRPRNPDIARILYLRGLVEMRGVGMLRMLDEMASLGLPAPCWENRSGGVQVTLSFSAAAANQAQHAAAEMEARSLSERSFVYLTTARSGERITREEYQERFAKDVAERSARNDLKRLVDFGYIRQVGAASKTAYIRTNKPAPQL